MRRAPSGPAPAILALLLAALASTGTAPAQPLPGPPTGSKAWTADDILLAESAGGFAVSPDGQRAVWVKSQMDKEKGERVSNLFLSPLTGERSEVQLTRGKDRHRDPRWSPDGRTIAFLSNRALPEKKEKDDDEAARTQLWLVAAQGGEPWPLTGLDRGIVDFAWKDDATIVIAAPEEKSLAEQKRKEAKDTSQAVEDAEREPPVRLFSIEVKGGRLTRLTENRDWIDSVKVSPDGRWAVALHQRSLSFQFDHRVPPALVLHDLKTGTTRGLLEGTRLLATSAEWVPDSKGFYFVPQHSSHPTYFTASIQLLQYVDAETGRATPVDLQWKNGLGSPRVLPTADGFLALLADGVRFRPARYTRAGSGWTRQDLSGEHARSVFDWALGKDGVTLVYEHSTAMKPAQWHRARLAGAAIEKAAALTGLNPGFEGKPVHEVEVVSFKGARGDEVAGVLYYPIGHQKGKRYPLLLSIHGGPAGGADMDVWDQSYAYPKLLIAQKGAFLLEVNYHGGSNFGLEWVESICCGNYYDLERVDLEAGVDHVIGRGLADPEKLGTMGWSNGAILTTELVTRSRRFKVASAGAGDVEWISDWGNVDFGASFDNYYFGKAPYEDPELYVRKSPYFRLKDVTTPTILYTGTEDRNVPPSQSWSHFRVMQQATKTPVRLILFPGEPHGLRKYVHQKRKVEEDLAWFDSHLFGTEAAPPAAKEGSPLEAALERKGFAQQGGLYGRTVKGRLVPEAVAHEGLQVARFEVTRAQFAAFDPKQPVAPGAGNLPAAGATFEQAKAYAAWLASLTGERWRLPAAEEAKTLYGGDRAGENTLDRWAGYAPNPEDAARVREKAAGLGGTAPLLEEVGRHRGRGEGPKVYDLGGNAAEWTVGADGKGVLAGGSADQPAGTPGPSSQAGEAYRGFRVVAGEARAKAAP
jgi:dipeptidyl aminopeptidase/acylaminoacyl peptidase